MVDLIVVAARTARVVLAALTAVALVGCGEADPTPPAAADPAAQAAAFHEELVANGHDDQAGLLEDGTVTDAEYRQAMLWTVECMAQHGVSLELFRVETLTRHQWDWNMERDPGVTADAAIRADEECQSEFSFAVSVVHTLSNQTIRDDMRSEFQECLADHGIDLGETRTLDELQSRVTPDDRTHVGNCRVEVEANANAHLVGLGS